MVDETIDGFSSLLVTSPVGKQVVSKLRSGSRYSFYGAAGGTRGPSGDGVSIGSRFAAPFFKTTVPPHS